MRKIFVCFFVVLVLASLAVPAFAYGSSGTSEIVYYSVLPFDEVQWDADSRSYSYPFPFNSILQGSSIQYFSFYESMSANPDYENFFGWCGAADDGNPTPSIVGDLNVVSIARPSTGSVIDFVGGNKILSLDYILSPDIKFEFDVNGARINNTTFRCTYWTIEQDPVTHDYYQAKLNQAAWTEAYYPNNVIDIAYSIRQALRDAPVGENGLIYLNSYSFSINFTVLNNSTPSFCYFSTTNYAGNPDSPSSFIGWFDDLELLTPASVNQVVEFDIFSWLKNGVSAFLQMEIFPDFTIDQLFWLVMVIGVMLWFITLLI